MTPILIDPLYIAAIAVGGFALGVAVGAKLMERSREVFHAAVS
jgi:enoyl reductase-like protein